MGNGNDSERMANSPAPPTNWLRVLAIGLLTSGILASIAANTRLAVLDSRVAGLEEWKAEGGRYTDADGIKDLNICLDRVATEARERETADNHTDKELERLEKSVAECKRRNLQLERDTHKH